VSPTIDPVAKLSIRSLESPRLAVTAMFNPADLRIDHSVPWRPQATSHGDQPSLEFPSAISRVMSFELLFDGSTTGTNVHAAFLADLFKLALVRDASGSQDKKRPPRVSVKWGTGMLPEFEGVIESLSTRYLMFLPDGTPVKATCHVSVREADHLSVAI
jgi:hypothetical protein